MKRHRKWGDGDVEGREADVSGDHAAAVRRKKGRGHVLDEFCGMIGLSRKHAVKALSPKRPAPGRRG